MNAPARVLVIESRELLRSLVPITWLRLGVLGAVFGVSVVLTTAAALLPMRGGGPPDGAVTGFLMVNLGIAVAFAVGAAAATLRDPEKHRLLLVAPIRPRQLLVIKIVPIVALAWVPLTVFYLPFVVAFFRQSLVAGSVLLLMGLVITAWALQFALWIVASLVRSQGHERGLRLAYALSGLIALGGMTGFGLALQLAPGILPVLVLAIASVAVLPRWMAATGAEYFRLLTAEPAPRESHEPAWGDPTWWALVRRSPSFAGVALLLPILGIVLLSDVPLRSGLLAYLLLVVATAPLGHVFEAEYRAPDRWRLAPEGSRMVGSALLRVAVPPTLVATAVAAGAGWGEWVWILAVFCILACGAVSFTIMAALPRKLLQAVLMLAALSSEVLR